MATPQVFIVDKRTFPLHLRYRFAGTTPGRRSKRERNIGLLADIARVRPGDPVVFYLQQYGFYGVFRIADGVQHPFWEQPGGWLQEELGVNLIYRVLIEPLEVYQRPITEWEAIDKLPPGSRDILWSLIYRKLKGERGCSYLFQHEYERLLALFRSKNPEGAISGPGEPNELTWEDGEIRVVKGVPRRLYKGARTSPLSHINLGRSETHLQAWLTWHIGRNPDPVLERLCGKPSWFANEVYAGMGMQKMDILTIQSGDSTEYRIIELKDSTTHPKEMEQLRRYIWWLKDYIWKEGERIQPIWVCKGMEDLSGAEQQATKLAGEEGCLLPQIWQWEVVGNVPKFTKIWPP